MNLIKEVTFFKKYLMRSKNFKMNEEIRMCVTKSITNFTALESSIPIVLHATLTDVDAVIEKLKLNDALSIKDILGGIKNLCELHTNITDDDVTEYVELLQKYTNAIEMFMYYKLDQIHEVDLAKLLIINNVSYLFSEVDNTVYV